jgi:hypothetical protein
MAQRYGACHSLEDVIFSRWVERRVVHAIGIIGIRHNLDQHARVHPRHVAREVGSVRILVSVILEIGVVSSMQKNIEAQGALNVNTCSRDVDAWMCMWM